MTFKFSVEKFLQTTKFCGKGKNEINKTFLRKSY